jgi:hypothetical protein
MTGCSIIGAPPINGILEELQLSSHFIPGAHAPLTVLISSLSLAVGAKYRS